MVLETLVEMGNYFWLNYWNAYSECCAELGLSHGSAWYRESVSSSLQCRLRAEGQSCLLFEKYKDNSLNTIDIKIGYCQRMVFWTWQRIKPAWGVTDFL